MNTKCRYCGKSRSSYPNLCFRRFPFNESTRKTWLSLLGFNEDDYVSKKAYICSEHFKNEDIIIREDDSCYIKYQAYPARQHKALSCSTNSPYDNHILENHVLIEQMVSEDPGDKDTNVKREENDELGCETRVTVKEEIADFSVQNGTHSEFIEDVKIKTEQIEEININGEILSSKQDCLVDFEESKKQLRQFSEEGGIIENTLDEELSRENLYHGHLVEYSSGEDKCQTFKDKIKNIIIKTERDDGHHTLEEIKSEPIENIDENHDVTSSSNQDYIDELEKSEELLRQFVGEDVTRQTEDNQFSHVIEDEHPGEEGQKTVTSKIEDAEVKDNNVEEIYRCHVCNFETRFKKAMKAHFTKSHNRDNGQCKKCRYSSHFKCDSKCHAKLVHRLVKTYNCRLCEFSTTQYQSFKVHNNTQHDIVTVQRKVDGFLDYIHDVKRKKCRFCNFKTYSSFGITEHMNLVHLKHERFKCNLCEYAVHLKEDLEDHVNTVHVGVRKHKCQMCDYESDFLKDMKHHVKSFHFKKNTGKIPRRAVETLKCLQCDFVTSNKKSFKNHVQFKHTERTDILKCNWCDFETNKTTTLYSHKRLKHSGVYKCPKCDFRGHFNVNIIQHFQTEHSEDVYLTTS